MLIYQQFSIYHHDDQTQRFHFHREVEMPGIPHKGDFVECAAGYLEQEVKVVTFSHGGRITVGLALFYCRTDELTGLLADLKAVGWKCPLPAGDA